MPYTFKDMLIAPPAFREGAISSGALVGTDDMWYYKNGKLFAREKTMQKIKTTVRIAGRDYAISSYDSEAYVQNVAAWVDRRMRELNQTARLPGGQLAVLTAINAVDDMMKSREENRRLKRELEAAHDEIERLKRNEKA